MRHPRSLGGLILVATLALLGYTIQNLGINSDNVSLIAEDLPARINHEEFARQFPNLENALLVLVDAETPELSRRAAVKLAHRMRRRPEYFADVYMPGGGSFSNAMVCSTRPQSSSTNSQIRWHKSSP